MVNVSQPACMMPGIKEQDSEVNLGSTDIQSELHVKDIETFDFNFFIFLYDKSDQAFDCKFDRQSNTIEIKLKEEVDEEESRRRYEEAKHLIDTLRRSFKESYTLTGKEMKIAKEFAKDTDLLDQYEHVFVDNTLNKGDEMKLVIMASNEHDEMFRKLKHKFEVQIGRKRITKDDRSRRRITRRASFQRQSSVLRSSEKKDKFLTFEKINVIISTDNLENIDGEVDGIVDPTNEKFGPTGQVSQLLRNRGGERYQLKCDQLSTQFKTRRPASTSCFSTDGGELKSKKVLHAVCPNIQAYKETDIENTVFKTVYNCLRQAEEEKLGSVAIPFLYTGHGNISVDICATPYAHAVIEFSRKRVDKFVVDTIYFIDLDELKTKTLVEHFSELLPKTTNQLLELPVLLFDECLEVKQEIATPSNVEVQIHEEKQSEGIKAAGSSPPEKNNDTEKHTAEENDTIDDGHDIIEFVDDQLPNEPVVESSDITMAHKPANIDDGYEKIEDIDESQDHVNESKDEANLNINVNDELRTDKDITKMQDSQKDEACDTPYSYVDVQEYINVPKVQQEGMKPEISEEHGYYNQSKDTKHTNMIGSNVGDPTFECISEIFSGQTHTGAGNDGSQVKVNNTTKEQALCQRSLVGDVTVEILKDDIRKTEVDVLICPEVLDTKYGGLLAVSIKCAFRKMFQPQTLKKLVKSKGKRVATTDCRKAEGSDTQRGVKFIYHVQTSVYKTAADKEKLRGSIQLVFRKLKRHRDRNIRTIAFPLLGIEDVSDESLVTECCKIMARAVCENCRKYEKDVAPLKVVLINRCGRITETLIREVQHEADPPVLG